ncbi:MAG: esterase family protein [Bacteroides sp.]|nr:esterase family protein [Bacteroides sp.]
MKKRNLLICLSLLMALCLQAADVEQVKVKSRSMNKDVDLVVVVPDVARTGVACPVIYLLHGYGGNARSWIDLKPELPQIADEKGIIFVCPDGKNSWYWDSPLDSTYRYETFISSEMISYVDANYSTVKDRKGRAIAGLSMGGHGALWNAIRHKDIFGAAGSMSGGVDIRPFPLNWEMSNQLGEYAHNKGRWDKHMVANEIKTLQNGDLALIIDCGDRDFFYEVNCALHTCLQGLGIEHDFIIRPGVHNGAYWNNAIDYQVLYFDKYFKK